jgi:hypothetical protein
MVDNSGKILKSIRPGRIIWPLLIGLGVTLFSLKDFDWATLSMIEVTLISSVWLLMAMLLMVLRDLGYIWRLRILSGGELSWKKCLNIVMLWEFTSAVTPSAIGGTSVAIFFVNKEGVSIGKSSAIVMMTSFLDELYFILVFPVVIILMGHANVIGTSDGVEPAVPLYESHFFTVAIIGYLLKLGYTIVLSYGLLINPRGLKWLLLLIFKLPIIRRWRPEANQSGEDLVKASTEFRKWPLKNWFKAFIATSISWTSRYWVVNMLILFFFGYNYFDFQQHLVVFGKQLIMWVMMLVTPTPGGSGFAEYFFKEILANDIPLGMSNVLAFLWRLISYYPYLFIGIIIIPRWIRKHFLKA